MSLVSRVLTASSKASFKAASACGSQQQVRSFHRSNRTDAKVTVIGAAGGIGQPLSLLMKNNIQVEELNLYDLAPITPGVAADISHIPTPAKTRGFVGADQLKDSLRDVDVVVVPAGVPRKPGMTRDDLFDINGGIVAGIANACAEVCPNACYLIISNPVNSTVPIFAEVLKKHGKYNPKKLFGVTTLDVCRANTFVAENQGTDVLKTNVNVIGGHAGTTILPLLSQVPGANFSESERDALTQRIMFGGDEVVQAKAGGGSATLSMAEAGARFASSLIRALKGEKGIKECTFVENADAPTDFFATPVTLGTEGVEEIHSMGELSAFEQQKLDEMKGDLANQIAKGVAFVNK